MIYLDNHERIYFFISKINMSIQVREISKKEWTQFWYPNSIFENYDIINTNNLFWWKMLYLWLYKWNNLQFCVSFLYKKIFFFDVYYTPTKILPYTSFKILPNLSSNLKKQQEYYNLCIKNIYTYLFVNKKASLVHFVSWNTIDTRVFFWYQQETKKKVETKLEWTWIWVYEKNWEDDLLAKDRNIIKKIGTVNNQNVSFSNSINDMKIFYTLYKKTYLKQNRIPPLSEKFFIDFLCKNKNYVTIWLSKLEDTRYISWIIFLHDEQGNILYWKAWNDSDFNSQNWNTYILYRWINYFITKYKKISIDFMWVWNKKISRFKMWFNINAIKRYHHITLYTKGFSIIRKIYNICKFIIPFKIKWI